MRWFFEREDKLNSRYLSVHFPAVNIQNSERERERDSYIIWQTDKIILGKTIDKEVREREL